MFSERPSEGRSCVRCFLASSIWRRSALERDPTAATNLREVVLSDTAPGSDAVSPGPSLRSTHAGVEGGSPESPRAARGSMASRWENSFVLLTLSLEVQRPGCEPSPWLSRVGAASGLSSGRLARAQLACVCPDTWPLVDLCWARSTSAKFTPQTLLFAQAKSRHTRGLPELTGACTTHYIHTYYAVFTPIIIRDRADHPLNACTEDG